MGDRRKDDNDIFSRLDGTPAMAMVIIGLAFTLLAPVVPGCRHAGVESAEGAFAHARTVIGLEVEALQQRHRKEREREEAKEEELSEKARKAGAASDFGTAQKLREDLDALRVEHGEAGTERQKALESEREKLEDSHDLLRLQRDIADAKASAAGVTGHLYLAWIGRVLLILGLLVLAVRAEGPMRWLYLALLLVVLFGALPGASLGFETKASLGG